MKRKEGISLIVLVITIIVIIILAGSVILSLANNNPIGQATEASFKTSVDAYQSELSMAVSNKYTQNSGFDPLTFDAGIWNGGATAGTIKEFIPGITAVDGAKFVIQDSKLCYVGTDATEKKWSKDIGAIQVIFAYNYTGNFQTFVAPMTATYKLELWGAAGGKDAQLGGAGGYSTGTLNLTEGQTIYVYVGGQGANSANNTGGGWNGGGNAGPTGSSGGGGGATDIRSGGQALTNRAIIAGGGGGGGVAGVGGTGGGTTGSNGVNSTTNGATQTAGGTSTNGNGALGIGANHTLDGGGGGGGYYGGGAGNGDYGGGGGSGYIGGVTGGAMVNGVQLGNGKAVITML